MRDEKQMIKVSVIIPTHNREDILMRTIFSVQKQTERNTEILICDDGSTDRTKERVEKLCESDTRIRYIDCGHNGRPAIPRNIGIREAKGEWLAFLDDDDLWNPVKLEVQLHELEKSGLKACCTNAFLYEDGKNTGKRYFPGEEDRIYSFKDIIRVNPVICSSMMIHRSLIESCMGFAEGERLAAIEDYAFWYRICGYTDICYVGKALTGYLVTSSTSIRKSNALTFEEQQAIVEEDFAKWLEDKGDELKRKYETERKKSRKLAKQEKSRSRCQKLLAKAKRIVKRLIGRK